MNKIFLVVSNLKHNKELHEKGSFIEAAADAFESLVADGVLRVIEGAKTAEEAAAIIQKEISDAAAAQREVERGTIQQNTWEATKAPQEEVVPEAPAAPTEEQVKEPEAQAPGTVGQGDVPPAPPTDAGANL